MSDILYVPKSEYDFLVGRLREVEEDLEAERNAHLIQSDTLNTQRERIAALKSRLRECEKERDELRGSLRRLRELESKLSSTAK